MSTSGKSVWELLWDYDPNGLVVVNRELKIQLANPAFCEMFKTSLIELIQRNAADLMDDAADFTAAWEQDQIIRREKHYAALDLYVRKVMFPMRNQGIVACIMVDMTRDWKQRQELLRLKAETLQKVDMVVEKQMKTAQEIASLLGETTAATKVQMLKLQEMLRRESDEG